MRLALIYFNHQECWAMFQRKYLGDGHARSSLPSTVAAQPRLVLDSTELAGTSTSMSTIS